LYREPVEISWDEFKEYKNSVNSKKDNFRIILDFIRSYYNMSNTFDIYNTLQNDELGKMMLDKRDIKEPMDLEEYLYKKF